MNDGNPKYCEGDGNEVNPDFIPKPGLCVTCRRDERSGEEAVLCNLTRSDQQGEPKFYCDAYSPKEP